MSIWLPFFREWSPFHGGGEKERGGYDHTDSANPFITIHPSDPAPAFTATHEYGHHIDLRHLGTSPGAFGSQGKGAKSLMAAILKSPEAKKLKAEHRSAHANTSKNAMVAKVRKHLNHQVDPREFFARAYSQYITHKSKHPDLIRGLNSDRGGNFGTMRHWSDESFEPVSKEFDALFASRKR